MIFKSIVGVLKTRLSKDGADMEEIRKKMMELQEQQIRLAGDTGFSLAGSGGSDHQQPTSNNVFETREERRRRLIEAERSRQMMKMKEQVRK